MSSDDCGPTCPECCPGCGQGHASGVDCPACRYQRAIVNPQWTGGEIDWYIPDTEPEYTQRLTDRAVLQGNADGMGAVEIAEMLGYSGQVPQPPIRQSILSLAPPARSTNHTTVDTDNGRYRLPWDTYPKPNKPSRYHCPNFGRNIMRRRCDSGNPAATPIACGDCPQCLDWYRYQKAYQFDRMAHNRPLQTVMTVADLDDDNAAAHALQTLHRYNPQGSRIAIMGRNPETYKWQAMIVYADAFSERTDGLIAYKMAGYNGYENVTFEQRSVNGQELAAMIEASGKTPNGHQRCRFIQWCQPVDDTPDTYEYGDGQIDTVPADLPNVTRHQHACSACANAKQDYRRHTANYPTGKAIPTYPDWRAMQSVKRWFDPERTRLSRDAIRLMAGTMRGGADDVARGLYTGILASGYEGPRKLIADLAAAIGDDGNIRPDARRCLAWAWYALAD